MKYYENGNIAIETVTDLFKIVNKYRNDRRWEGENLDIYFRGQSNMNWDLYPSLFRSNGLLENEHNLFNELKMISPVEFDGHLTDFNKLTKMQHYTLTTRLLDITSNPLVALYFACADDKEKDKDGDFFIIDDYKIKNFQDLDVKILSSFVTFSKNDGYTLDDFYRYLANKNITIYHSNDKVKYLRRLRYIRNILCSEIIVKSEMRNRRIRQQNGAFILFGTRFDEMENMDDDVLPNVQVEKISYVITKDITTRIGYEFIIPSESKIEILEELSFLGIHEGSLFPELENQASYIKRKYKKTTGKGTKSEVAESTDYNYNVQKSINTTTDNNKLDGMKKNDEQEVRNIYIKKRIDNKYNNESDLNRYILEMLKNYYKIDQEILDSFFKDLLHKMENIIGPDWWKRDIVRANLRVAIKRLVREYNVCKKINHDEFSNMIINYQEGIIKKSEDYKGA